VLAVRVAVEVAAVLEQGVLEQLAVLVAYWFTTKEV
jgi:hypothetical protein